MNDKIKITLIIAVAAVVIALILSNSFSSDSSTTENTVQVNGVSQVDVSPDLVSVYFTVQTYGNTSSDAKDSNAQITDDVITNLIKLGFDRDEIQTSGFNIWENTGGYYPGAPVVKANEKFVASHTLIVKIKTEDKDKIGETIDAGVDAGATLNYVNFELSKDKENEYKIKAIQKATEDAKEKAEALASGLGKKLGKVVSVTNTDFQYYPWVAYATTDSMAVKGSEVQTNIVPSDQVVTSSVTVVYKLI